MREKGVNSNAALAAALRGLSGSTSISGSSIVSAGAHVKDARKRALTAEDRTVWTAAGMGESRGQSERRKHGMQRVHLAVARHALAHYAPNATLPSNV